MNELVGFNAGIPDDSNYIALKKHSGLQQLLRQHSTCEMVEALEILGGDPTAVTCYFGDGFGWLRICSLNIFLGHWRLKNRVSDYESSREGFEIDDRWKMKKGNIYTQGLWF